MTASRAVSDFEQALALHKAGRIGEALAGYRKVLDAFPDHADSLNLLGAALIQTGEAAQALPPLERVCALRPGFADAHSNRAAALQVLERYAEAEAESRAALAVRADYPEALNNLGAALQAQDRQAEAIEAYRKSLALRPDAPDTLNGLSVSLKLHGLLDEAEETSRRVIALNPDAAESHSNRAAALKELGRYEEALEECRTALALKPTLIEALGNLAVTLSALQRTEEAEEAYRHALALRPDFDEIRWNLSMILLSQGRFREGWPDYEHRWIYRGARKLPGAPIPLWPPAGAGAEAGASTLTGKRVLIQFEQGFGDAIQMLRYVPHLEAIRVECTVEVPEALRGLIARSLPRTRVVGMNTVPTGIDYRIALMSLPLVLGTWTEAAIPRTIPYLQADPEAVARWRTVIRPDPRPKFGLVWRGNAIHINDRNRSAKLDDFLPLLENRNALWFILQKDLTPEETERLKAFGTAVVFDPALRTFDDTAALLEFIDVVISVDSAPVHLAGALGKRTAVLLPFHADWRWQKDREDSPWYPTARLYRQPALKDWASVVARIGAEIQGASVPRT